MLEEFWVILTPLYLFFLPINSRVLLTVLFYQSIILNISFLLNRLKPKYIFFTVFHYTKRSLIKYHSFKNNIYKKIMEMFISIKKKINILSIKYHSFKNNIYRKIVMIFIHTNFFIYFFAIKLFLYCSIISKKISKIKIKNIISTEILIMTMIILSEFSFILWSITLKIDFETEKFEEKHLYLYAIDYDDIIYCVYPEECPFHHLCIDNICRGIQPIW